MNNAAHPYQQQPDHAFWRRAVEQASAQGIAAVEPVLRVAAERLTQQWSGVAYFSSYEIITGSFNRGQYFGVDMRSVTAAGVDQVMRLFLQHYLNVKPSEPVAAAEPPARDGLIAKMTALTRADCDEEALAR